MDTETKSSIDQRLEETMERLYTARKNRADGIEASCQAKDIEAVSALVAGEMEAEKKLEQSMQFFADQADIFAKRSSTAKRKSAMAEADECASKVKAFSEAKEKCLEELQASETHQALLLYLELKVSLATKEEIQAHLTEWTNRAEMARKTRNSDLEDYSLESQRICQKALDEFDAR